MTVRANDEVAATHGLQAASPRITDGVLAEQWDVLHDEATRAESKRGLPVFGDRWTQ
jgi:hypothetical protein